MTKKALIITSKLVQDHEFIYPFYRLKEEGYDVHTCNCEKKQTLGYFGTKIPPKEDDKIVQIDEIDVKNYDVLILPGGVKSMEILRLNKDLIEIIKKFDQNKKVIGKGLTHFNQAEVELIRGSHSDNIESILGYRGKDEVVHRDDLVLDKSKSKTL